MFSQYFLTKSTLWVTVKPPTPPPSDIPGACPTADWVPHGRFCYSVQTTCTPWSQAEFQCVQMGGHLASIADMNENVFIQSQLQVKALTKNVWTGLLKRGTSKCFFNQIHKFSNSCGP